MKYVISKFIKIGAALGVVMAFASNSAIVAQGTAGRTVKVSDLLGVLTSAHNLVFGKDNLITQPISPQESQQWQQAIDAISKFVIEKGPQFKADINNLKQASDALLTKLNTAYTIYIKPVIIDSKNKEKGVDLSGAWLKPTEDEIKQQYNKEMLEKAKNAADWSKIDLPALDRSITALQPYKNTADDVIKTVDKILKGTANQAVKDAATVLNYLSIVLSETLNKVLYADLNTIKVFTRTYGKK